jgi:uncharacterized protein
MAKITSSKDLIMLLLYAAGPSGALCEPIQGQTRLMKMVFLFKKELASRFDKEIDASAFPDFEAYDFGPFSSDVYSDLEFLVNNGFVTVLQEGESDILEEEQKEYEYWTATAGADENLDSSYLGRKFQLSGDGREFAQEELASAFSQAQLKVLGDFKKRCVEASLRSLLRYVYTRYEDMTTKSKIREDILG